MDHINSTLAHGPETRLPKEFYDAKARAIIDKIGVEEWFAGLKESNEYRTVAIGSLAADIVTRMVGSVKTDRQDGRPEKGGERTTLDRKQTGETPLKFAMSGCHDTTLAALLCSVGAFDDRPWPPYTSHIAFELFKDKEPSLRVTSPSTEPTSTAASSSSGSWLGSIFGSSPTKAKPVSPSTSSRKPLDEMTPAEKGTLKGHYVRIRYNDEAMTVPRCKLPGNHFEGDETLCTLVGHLMHVCDTGSKLNVSQEAFKSVVDSFTPRTWKSACMANLDKSPFPREVEAAGQ